MTFTFSLPSGVTAQVAFSRDPTKRDAAKLQKYLEVFADDLPDEATAPQSPEGAD